MTETLHSIPLTMIGGQQANFGDFKGKTVLVVNVASECGLTPQYEALEALYRRYSDKDFVILGVPSNQFMGQEPGNAEDIQEFCSINYGVTFPLAEKADVNGADRHPLYAALTKFRSGELAENVTWNFEKFLVSAEGKVVQRFAPQVTPDSHEVGAAIEAELN
ncbi:glutathione peroxidase [Arthrobacter sp. NA-172]|uniref:glutathione peroxidase n=1 Tax=Arthrobacter sp. NA-172 TaxID=3367524 RepID=UPI0037540DA9